MRKVKYILFITLIFPIMFYGCSKKSKSYGTTEKNFKNKHFPRDNEFIMNGGYKIKVPKNPFVSSKEAVEVYNKDNKNSLADVPSIPENLKKN
ncbi:hypothetical protein N3Z17_00540 [Candidatus Bandiella numerosa]|jgi:hypothetical protein|uniref:hypothetical protein n=1 Tax=Candidatus Bandiella numerosa TaxID=2570586 RepID=UPI00249F0440|nr:hypothetical protein [Candidatus Bandiella numerosa]WHA05038.1 hypothetical protein N3Z17_00540 [Candidatus Bandiella numerosa]